MSGAGFEASIAARAAVAGIQLHHAAIRALAGHASAVLAANPLLHLTTVTDPVELVERHIGESLEGAEVYDMIEEMTGLSLGPELVEAPPEPEPVVPEESIAASEASEPEEPEPGGTGPEPLPAPST